MNRFEACLPFLLKEEGGFVDHPDDPGGITNLGVTRETWQRYTGKKASEATMRALTPADVAPLYKKQYWDRVRADEVPIGLDLALFDFAVNSGPVNAIRHLQDHVDTDVDGIFGPATMTQVWKRDTNEIIIGLCQSRLDFLRTLPHWKTFGKGWEKRISRVASASLAARFH